MKFKYKRKINTRTCTLMRTHTHRFLYGILVTPPGTQWHPFSVVKSLTERLYNQTLTVWVSKNVLRIACRLKILMMVNKALIVLNLRSCWEDKLFLFICNLNYMCSSFSWNYVEMFTISIWGGIKLSQLDILNLYWYHLDNDLLYLHILPNYVLTMWGQVLFCDIKTCERKSTTYKHQYNFSFSIKNIF